MKRSFRGEVREAAFTLIEIALALGIAGFALVAILGMLPVAIDNSRQSRLQTRAVFISRGIFEDLKAGNDGKAMVKTTNTGGNSDFTLVDTTNPLDRSFTMAWDIDGKLLNTSGNYLTGEGMPASAIYVGQLHLLKAADKPLVAELSLETPATASQANRKVYFFVSELAL